MIEFRRLTWSFPTALLLLLFCVPASWGQSGGGGNDATSTPEPEKAGTASGMFNGGLLPYTLPDPFKGHLVGQFSVGEVRDSGILNGIFPALGSQALTDSEVSTSFAYDLRKKHSDYLFDYRATGRHYNRYPQLDVISHDLGLSQALQLGPRTNWTTNYRYSMTPDYAGTLMGETLSQQMSFINPLPVAGIGGIPTFGAPFQVLLSPADGLITLRSNRMTNSAYTDFSHDLSFQTRLTIQAGFGRVRFEDKNLFGMNQYSLKAVMSHFLTPRTSIGIGFQGGRLDQSQVFNQTMNEGVSVYFTKQFGRRTFLSLSGGPALIEIRSQEAIPLSSLLANLLGRPSLNHGTSLASLGWLGAANLSSNIHDLGISLGYDRSVTGTGGLGGASLTQIGTVSLSRVFRQRTTIAVAASYIHMQMLGLLNPIEINQEGLTASFTRMLSRSLDFSILFVYAKAAQGQQGPTLLNQNPLDFNAFLAYATALNGQHGLTLLNHNQLGVRFVYHFPRLRVAGS